MGDTRGGDRGLAEDGTIRREGSLSRVPATFAPVVEAARSRITDAFDAAQWHSAYLYRSIPRVTAIPGVSDLDLLPALHAEPTESDQAAARPSTPLSTPRSARDMEEAAEIFGRYRPERIGERRPDDDGSSSSGGAAPRTSAAQSRPHRAGHLPQMYR
ncbi:hypothetical protein [Streptomyces sp. DT203]|uniref:hypothetical protein n=1 Tax=Streptomyces sp. DT203 TaxID=3393424 RepID=UPI003CF8CC3D